MHSTKHTLIIAAALALATPAAASANVLAPYDGWQVAQHAGVQAWSQQRAKHRFVLMIRSAGSIARAPVAAQRTSFDVALGDDAHGHELAVYPRCSPAAGGGRCHLVAYDLATKRERALTATHAAGASEDTAALDHGTLAFARRTGGRSAIMIARLGSRRPARVAADVPGAVSYVTGLTLSARALSYTVQADPATGEGESLLYVKRGGRAARLVARGSFGEQNEPTEASPSIAGHYLYWAFSNQSQFRPASGLVARCNLRTGRVSTAAAPGYLDAVAADAARPADPLVVGSFGLATDPVRGVDQIATLGTPAWHPPTAALDLIHRASC